MPIIRSLSTAVASGLPLEHGGSSVVGCGRSGPLLVYHWNVVVAVLLVVVGLVQSASGLPLERGGSIVVGRGQSGLVHL